jgi:hypothetical protein
MVEPIFQGFECIETSDFSVRRHQASVGVGIGITSIQRPYSVIRGFVNARMSIAIVRATHLCLRGSRVSASKISRRFLWEDSAGLGLFRSDYSH